MSGIEEDAEVHSFFDFKLEIEKYFTGVIVDTGMEMEWPMLNALYRPAKGTLNVITGIPSHGKSSIMDAIMISLTKKHKFKWCVFSPENYPTYLHIQKLMELWSGLSFFHGDEFTRMHKEQFDQCSKEMEPYFTFLNPYEEKLTLTHLLELVEMEIESGPVDGFVIDPWNELVDENLEGESETKYIGRALSVCRRFARKNNLLFYILAHPKMMYKKPAAKKYDVPTLYSISGSANWYNKSDNGLTIYRNFDFKDRSKESVDIHIQKVKFKSHGTIGVVKMKYDFWTGRLTEISADDAAIEGFQEDSVQEDIGF